MSLQPTNPVVINGGDTSCVHLLLELRSHMRELPSGTEVHLIASDPAAPIDLPAWCHLTGHVYLGPMEGHGGTAYGLRVASSPRETEITSPWRITR
ncbi:hypothetical protein SUDANB121_00018 [Nocardiopsis dassonvillei]